MSTQDESVLAPHGRDENGTPLAPFGLKVDGTPRKSRRGASPGSKGNTGTSGASRGSSGSRSATKLSLTDRQRKEALMGYSAILSQGLIGISMAKPVTNRIGQKQSDALACDGLVLSSASEALVDGLIHLSQFKPGVLAWVDKAEENSPYLQLAMVGAQIGAAFVRNHLSPDPRMAKAARDQMLGQAQQMAQESAQASSVPPEAQDAMGHFYEPQAA